MRVVSLLPSATEVLCAIGGESLLVGRSHECDVPTTIADRPVLTAARTTAGSSAVEALGYTGAGGKVKDVKFKKGR